MGASAETREKVAAVVVTYNRRELLRQCLDGILAQTRPVDAIYVIDNASTDGTDHMIAQQYAGKVIYVRLPENTGSSGGFHHGMKLAYEAGYDWIWVMDDDAQAEPDCLETLMQPARPGIGFLAPQILGTDGLPQAYHHKLYQRRVFTREVAGQVEAVKVALSAAKPFRIHANAFVGLLVRSALLAAVGLPERSFFIYWDDSEFSYRLGKRWECLLVPQAKIIHRDSRPSTEDNTWRAYYYTRNQIAFVRLHDGHPRSLLCAIYLLGKLGASLTRRLLVASGSRAECSAFRSVAGSPLFRRAGWFTFRGIVDGALNRLGAKVTRKH